MSKSFPEDLPKWVPTILAVASMIACAAVARSQLQDLQQSVNHLREYNEDNLERRAVLEQKSSEMLRILNQLQSEIVELRKCVMTHHQKPLADAK